MNQCKRHDLASHCNTFRNIYGNSETEQSNVKIYENHVNATAEVTVLIWRRGISAQPEASWISLDNNSEFWLKTFRTKRKVDCP